jgi:hypothetical protein
MASRKKLNKVSGINWVRNKFLKGLHKLKRIAFYNSTERRMNKQFKIKENE